MSFDINVITQSSNKTIEYVDLNSNIVVVAVSNEAVNLPIESYIVYISPEIQKVDYITFLSLSNTIFSGFLGYIWTVIIMVIFYFLIKGVKNYVK